MQVSVEQLEGLERRVTVQVPAEAVEKEIQNRLQSLSRKARLDGFRPGKVPLKVIQRMYGAQVRQEVLGETMERSFYNALQQENLRPVGSPRIEPINLEAGQQLEYRAVFEVLPEFTPKDIAERTINRPVADVTESDVDSMIESLRKQRAEWQTVERPAQSGDQVKISFHGTLDGEEFPGNQGDDAPVVLGQGAMLEDFERHLHGRVAGAETEFDLTFPEAYPAEHLAGRTVHFTVRIHSVAESRLPEVDAEFAKAFSVEDGTVEGLRKALRDNMERELADGIKANVKRQVMDALMAENSIPVPQSLVNQEVEHIASQVGFKSDKDDPEAAATKTRLFEDEARRRVTLGLIVARMLGTLELKPDQDRVQQRLETIAASYEDSNEVIGYYRQNQQLMGSINNLVLEDQLVDHLLASAVVEDQPSSFEDIMKPDKAAKSLANDPQAVVNHPQEQA